MKTISRVVVIVAVLALALPTFAASDITVGSFVQKLAQSKNLNATDARIAADSLRAVGVRVPTDLRLTAPLTEGDVARIARAAGLNVSTNRPEANFTGDQVNQFISTFGADLALVGSGDSVSAQNHEDGNGPVFNPYSKGKGGSKGKKKGHDFTPTEPE
jgi:hypothetical protein